MRNIVLIVAAVVLLGPTTVKAQGCYGGTYSTTQVYSSTQVMQTQPVYSTPVYAAPVYAAPVYAAQPMFASPMRGRFKQVFKMRGRGFFGVGAPVCGAGGCY